MNKPFDEETISVHVASSAEDSSAHGSGVRLDAVPALKNQARFMLAQQQGLMFNNPLLSASAELLSYVVSVKRMQCPEDMHAFRNGIKNTLTELKYKVAKLDYPPSVADKVCFLYAVMLDEQILHSPWGESSAWENQTLVSELFGIKNGGEQFFVVAERALLQPVLLVDLLEVVYVMLKLGFRGRYRNAGQEQLDLLLKRIEECVFSQKLSDKDMPRTPVIKADIDAAGLAMRPKRPVSMIRPVLLFILAIAASLSALYYWYQVTLPQKAKPFIELQSFTAPFYEQSGTQDVEYVYYSTAEEMSSAKQYRLQAADLNQDTTNVADWVVQLATFDNVPEAERFIKQYKQQLPNATIDVWRDMFRVISRSGSRVGATSVLNTAKSAGISDAFILSRDN